VRSEAPATAVRSDGQLAEQVASAYRTCEQITATEAGNFAWGIRLLPAPRRRALSAVYALARRIDDIGDSSAPPASRELALHEVRDQLADLSAVVPDPSSWPRQDPVLLAVADATARFGLPLTEFGILLDGCLADVRGIRYEDFDQLVGYCRQVAGSIGRLSITVFGDHDPTGPVGPLADALGTALQVTNIVRDIREDSRNGRVYLPAEDLRRFGCTLALDESGELADDTEALIALVEYEVVRALDFFELGLQILPVLDRRSRACCAAMAGIYREVLLRIAERPRAVLSGRVSLPDRRKLAVAFTSLAGSWRPARAGVTA